MKKVLKSLLVLVLLVVVALAGLLGWLTLTEYNPDPIETLEPLKAEAVTPLPQGATLDILSWNIGYAGLGAESDFIMDGGQNVRAADEATVQRYLDGINEITRAADYSFVILQEVDTDSSRTYNINQAEKLSYGTAYHAMNFNCPFVPNPVTYVTEPIGKVTSGLLTMTDLRMSASTSMDCSFAPAICFQRFMATKLLPSLGSELTTMILLISLPKKLTLMRSRLMASSTE